MTEFVGFQTMGILVPNGITFDAEVRNEEWDFFESEH